MVDQRRRSLLRCAAAGAVAGSVPLVGQLMAVRTALAESTASRGAGDYKSLVCLFQFGGNDAFNTLVPLDATEFGHYQTARGPMALPAAQLIPVGDGSYGMHPSLQRLSALYDTQRLAVVSNVGNLYEPVDKASFHGGSVALPGGLFSHSHQQQIWQTNLEPDPIETHAGWGGRLTDALRPHNPNALIDASLSMDGASLWQTADVTLPYHIDPFSERLSLEYLEAEGWQHSAARRASRAQAWNRILDRDYPHVMQAQMQQAYRKIAPSMPR